MKAIEWKPWVNPRAISETNKQEWIDRMRSDPPPDATITYTASGDTIVVAWKDGNGSWHFIDALVRRVGHEVVEGKDFEEEETQP